MKQSINLTSARKSVDSALRKILLASIAIFCLTIIISFSLIVYRLVLKSTFDGLDAKEQQLNSQLLAMVDKRDKLLETKSRISDITKIIAKRAPITNRLDTINSIAPADAQVDSISGSDKDLIINFQSSDLSALNTLIEQKITELASDKTKSIKKVSMSSFGLNPKLQKYHIALEVIFGT